ncbi:hypothetical protein BLNAU_3857 [Blattamonas nauphoetae]|uniref:Uncharacterized protein n=1 Tax=Blattamonas nauphoetae TaxID=2049346 RepID=A0ABQ9YBJ7_9EUKA|nr:hypothetical protein BLNAU_3857 [Blattamonas nauphoetae]
MRDQSLRREEDWTDKTPQVEATLRKSEVALANENADESSNIDTTASQCVFFPSSPASPTRTEHVALPHPPQLVLSRVSIAANRTPTIPPKHFRVISITGRSLNSSPPTPYPFFISPWCVSPTGNIDILALTSQLDSATPFVLHSSSHNPFLLTTAFGCCGVFVCSPNTANDILECSNPSLFTHSFLLLRDRPQHRRVTLPTRHSHLPKARPSSPKQHCWIVHFHHSPHSSLLISKVVR